jgi:hypothetical protein
VNQQYSAGTTPYMYPLRTGPFDYWAYASQYSNSQANQTQYPYTYSGYYPTQTAGIAQHHNPYTYTQTYIQNQNRSNQFNWQRPYQGPSAQEGVSMAQGTGTLHRFRLGPSNQSPSSQSPAQTSSSTQQQPHCQSSSNQLPSSTSSEKPAALDVPNTSESLNDIEKSSATPAAAAIAAQSSTTSSDVVEGIVKQVSVHKDLSVLSSLQPSQIAEILCNNPEIQSIVWAAVDQAMAKARNEAA